MSRCTQDASHYIGTTVFSVSTCSTAAHIPHVNLSCALSRTTDAVLVSRCICLQVPAYVPYAGRPPSASPATGFSDVHKREQEGLCSDAMNLEYA